jgi:release factor glutamine methyltransferase
VTSPASTVAPQSIRAVLASTSAALGSITESRWIVAQATGLRTGDLAANPDVVVTPDVSRAVQAMVDRRMAGEPLQYVLGSWAFRTLELRVDPRVLIPRPETEQVVGAALDELGAQGRLVAPNTALVMADLGTGSGAIALSLAVEFDPGRSLEVWATDASAAALEVARHNLADLGRRDPAAADRVRMARGSWFDALPSFLAGQLRLVVSNPPYVSESEWDTLDPVVRDHEPRAALVAGPTGLEALELLLRQAKRWLAPGGSVVVESAPGQAAALRRRAIELGYETADVRDDLAGRPRMLVARAPAA